MAKTSTRKKIKVKDLPRTKNKLTAKNMRKVKGGVIMANHRRGLSFQGQA